MPRPVEFALGAAILSHLLLALLWAGWATAPLAAFVTLAALGWFLRRALPGCRRPRFAEAAVFLPLGTLYLIHALAPETASDAIAYHLGLINEWLGTASLARRDWGLYDVIPHGMETLFFGAASLGGFSAAKLVHFAFFAATVPLLIEAGGRLQIDARPAALLYFATPVAAAAGTAAYNDAAVAFYALVTWLLLTDDEDTWAGLTAGFCYAIKLSGGVITLMAGVYLLRRRAWRGLLLAAAMVAPWLWLAFRATDGNPVAPMFASLFPSAAIHPGTIAGWTEFVRSYGVPWGERWREVTLVGERTQGLLGPAFLLSPLALLEPRLRWWTLAALAAWLLNAGTRFLIPAAVFIVLALAVRIPPRAMWALAVAQALVCWPAVLAQWTPADAWRLPASPPWRAALRLESEPDYLRRMTPAYAMAEMVNRHVRAGDRLLDLAAAPRAWLRGVEAVNTWQYSAGIRATEALTLAAADASPLLYCLRGAWPARKLATLRLELLAEPQPRTDEWSVQEVRLLRGGAALFPSQSWALEAAPNPWDAPLALDRNPVSAWRTREPRSSGGVYFEISGEFELDGIELLLRRDEAGPAVRVTGIDAATGARVDLAARLEPAPAVALNLRHSAVRYLRREGFRWILAAAGETGIDRVVRSLVNHAPDWGLTQVDRAGGVYLLRLGE
ncbi:MAG: hypothetical protein FJW31_16155 [Acidobacteria bacterium]|nr:hypothetical protein [Acidobacteriota bacterium]